MKNESLQLVSVHLPKCAGTSFQQFLHTAYGADGFLRVDIRLATGKTFFNQTETQAHSIPQNIKAVHGHFHPHHFFKKFPDTQHAKLIVFLRNPIERMLSDYRYMQQLLNEQIDTARYPNLLKRMKKNVAEFAGEPENANSMSRFLQGLHPEDFFFTGVLENMSEDLHILCENLKITKAPLESLNKTERATEPLPDELYQQLCAANRKDIEWYNAVVRFRGLDKSLLINL